MKILGLRRHRRCIMGFVFVFVWACTPLTSYAVEPTADSFRLPLDGEWNPSRGFADEFIQTWCGFHLADDVARAPGTPVFATANGTVKFASNVAKLGYAILVEHRLPDTSRVVSVHFHLRRPQEGGVALIVGQEVIEDAIIGFVSGNPEDYGTGPHLHFGFRRGAFLPSVDPRTEKWFYPGYTTIYQAGQRQCDVSDPVHVEIVGEWEDPVQFVGTSPPPPPPPLGPTANPDIDMVVEGGTATTGNVLSGVDFDSPPNNGNQLADSDGGAPPLTIISVSHDAVTKTAVDADGGGNVTLNTSLGGMLFINLETGSYIYTPPASVDNSGGNPLEVFSYTIQNGDGLTSSTTLSIEIKSASP